MDYICKDGVVLAESAMNMAGATINENSAGFTKDDFVLYGNIHQQMRNSRELKEKLEGKLNNDGTIKARGLYRGNFGSHFKLN